MPTLDETAIRSLLGHTPAGAHMVDPLSLHPAAVSSDQPWFNQTYKACYAVNSPPPGAPVGTAVVCYSGPVNAIVGDGTLSNDPNSNADGEFSFGCPSGFITADQAQFFLDALRFYDKSSNLIEIARVETWNGRLYNYDTGKSVHLFVDEAVTVVENPVDGRLDNAFFTFYGNDFGVSNGGKVLAISSGVIGYDPNGNVLVEKGQHPLDDYYSFGTTAGIVPICNALQ